jgi:hypothetical protein
LLVVIMRGCQLIRWKLLPAMSTIDFNHRPHSGMAMTGKAAGSRPSKPSWEPASMPIRLLLQDDHAFGPEEVAILTRAFDEALSKLGLVNRDDPATRTVAKRIIELAKQGERDPIRLRDAAISSPPT